MENRYPDFQCDWKRNMAIWTGYLRPTDISDNYLVKFQYAKSEFPKVWVLSPQLRKREGEKRIPHTYKHDRLCLFYPRAREWSSDMLIADTIIPWTSLWLFYYEIWYTTGEWLGDGIHPTKEDNDFRDILNEGNSNVGDKRSRKG
ncbi:hypothetical protein [Candidatus Aquicultor secundus]|uniref:hypothetical protein n=2 Tax=Candidatus Aquicultor secundus TaxID=1973895 RepID=UPI00257F9134|nr:hypothetical protein [Candidatus Aquicultor secundus]